MKYRDKVVMTRRDLQIQRQFRCIRCQDAWTAPVKVCTWLNR